LPEEFLAQPKQALNCALRDVQLVAGKSWPEIDTVLEYDSIFKECKKFTVVVKSVGPDGNLEVDMIRDDGCDVSELLRKYGFAEQIKGKDIRL